MKESLTPKYPADFAAVLSSIQNWVDIILSGEDDYTHKRNLVLATVKHVRCLDKAGNMELHVVMSQSAKWRPGWIRPGVATEREHRSPLGEKRKATRPQNHAGNF